MYWSYIVLGIILIILGFRYLSNISESFQNEDLSNIRIDISGINLNRLASELSKMEIDTTGDSRPVNNSSRLCDTLQKQIDTLEESKVQYKSLGDWRNVELSNKTINALSEQMTTLSCPNNNSQNN